MTQVTVIRSFQLKKIHKGDKSYNCDVCEIRFSFRNNVKQHILVYDADPVNKPKVPCRKCDKEFGNHAILRDHFRLKHTGEKNFIC